MSTNDPRNTAWGQGLEMDPNDGRVTFKGPLIPRDPNVVYLPTMTVAKSTAVTDAIAKLKSMANKLEKDIAYFNTFKSQAMAVNKFGVMKFDLNEIIASLEK